MRTTGARTRRMATRGLALTTGLAAAAAGLLGTAAPATAATHPTQTRSALTRPATAQTAGSPGSADAHRGRPGRPGSGPAYLALGDSVAFGYRPAEVTTPAQYADARNFVGYPEDLARAAGLRVTDASCPGETTASMMTPGALSNGCENAPGSPVGYRTTFPLHARYAGPQLAFAVNYLRSQRDTRLVSLDIGANDMFVCQTTTADHCTGTDFATTLKRVTANTTTILRTLRRQGGYHGRIVLVDYYALDYGDATGRRQIAALNDALNVAARAEDARIADGFTAFGQAAADSGGDSCKAGLLVQLPAGGCNIHPSAAGQWLLAGTVADATRRRP